MADITGEVLQGRYTVERMLGRGGMADVYLAFDTRRHTHVALKLIREDLADDADFIRRFSREAEALARLDHPNVVRYYATEQQLATATTPALAFIVMDYVPGTTLQRRIAQAAGPIALQEVTSILHQIGPALHYAHSLGFIHRDIKPGNIMLREDGTALLSDFGAARVSENATLASLTIGTPAYMSPEQILGRELQPQSDIYSFGLVLYEMLVGRRPFTGDEAGLTGTGTISRLREAHLRLDPPDPSALNPAVPAAAGAVVLKTLEKNEDDRWPTTVALMDAWDAALGRTGRRARPAPVLAPSLASAETIASPLPAVVETNLASGMVATQPSRAGGTVDAGPGQGTPQTQPGGAGKAPPGPPAVPSAAPTKRSVGPLIAAALAVVAILAIAAFTLPRMLTSGTAAQTQAAAPQQTATAGALAAAATATEGANAAAQAQLQQRADRVATAEAQATALAIQLAETAAAAGKVVEAAAAIGATATAQAGADQLATVVAEATSTAAAATADAAATAAAAQTAAAPTVTQAPTATQTATPAPAATAAPRPAAVAPTGAPAQSGAVADFESNTVWQIGTQRYGTFQRSTEQKQSGAGSQRLAYDFPATQDNFVVFSARPPIRLAGNPEGLTAWVYGDGSGHFLNAWVRDNAGEVRQYTFGQINHEGWQQMTAAFDDAKGWPNVSISGTDNGKLDFPAALSAIVLDGVPDGQASSGVIYIDDIRTLTGGASTGAAGATPGAAVSGTATPAGAAATAGGRLAFTGFAADRNTFDIYVGASGGARRVATGASQPAFSPNGASLAVRAWQNARGISVMPAAGGAMQQVSTFLEDALPSWSPSGDRLVFASRRESDRKSRLYQVPIGGGGDYEMRRGGEPIFGEYPTWLPDGAIAYRATGSETGLAVMNADGASPRMLLPDGSATAPAGAPGGAIAFMSQRDGNWEIYRIGRDGSGLTRLTNNPANDGLPAWAPDGSALAFVSDRDGSWGVWVMNADGSGQRKLIDLPASIDGRIAGEPDYANGGWTEERLSWSR